MAVMFQSEFLFARPSFLEGMARVVDWSGSLNRYNTMPSPEEADAVAMAADWAAVGEDLYRAVDSYRGQTLTEISRVEQKR